MRKALLLMGLLFGAALVAGCSAPASTLVDTNWKLIMLNGKKALPEVGVTLSFGQAGKLGGNAGCNSFSGAYKANGNQLTIEPGAMTMMACMAEVMQQESDFIAALAATRTYEIKDGRLILAGEAGKELVVFVPLQPAALAGVEWQAVMVNNGKEAVTSVLASTEITAQFSEDGRLTGKSGCNTYNTTYKTDGSAISIQPAATTRMACPPEVMEQEAQYLSALQSASKFKLGEKTLELRTAEGALLVSYKSAK